MTMFQIILFFGIIVLIAQGISSYFDGYLTQKQIMIQGINNGFSFLEHGGVWADLFIITPLVAYIVAVYKFTDIAWIEALVFSLILLIVVSMTDIYRKKVVPPQAYVHDGKRTLAGYLHMIYAGIAFWFILLFYGTLLVSRFDLMIVSVALVIFFPLGLIKFNSRWKLSAIMVAQLVMECTLVFLAVAVKLYIMHN